MLVPAEKGKSVLGRLGLPESIEAGQRGARGGTGSCLEGKVTVRFLELCRAFWWLGVRVLLGEAQGEAVCSGLQQVRPVLS